MNSIFEFSKSALVKDVHKIYNVIRSQNNISTNDFGALLNSAGYLTFLYNYAEIFDLDAPKDFADEILDNVLDLTDTYSENKANTISFCSGIVGLGWLTIHLKSRDFINFNESDFVALDEVAVRFFNSTISKGNYDFLHGAVGALYYLMSRDLDENNIGIVQNLVSALLEEAYENDEYLFWEFFDSVSRQKRNAVINLGLSHGTPSILVILSKLYKMSNHFNYLSPVIKKCAYTIIACKNKIDTVSDYPYNKNIFIEENCNSRHGWCYGDLGVSISLWHAGNALGDDFLLNEAETTLVKSSAKTAPSVTQVKDAGICHGSSGVSFIYYKYGKIFNNKKLLQSSNYWIDVTSKLIQPTKKCVTGRVNWNNNVGYNNNFSLLEGLTGVGLVMLSQITNAELKWEDSLLI